MTNRKQFIDGISPSTPRKKLDDFSSRRRVGEPERRPRERISEQRPAKNVIGGMISARPEAVKSGLINDDQDETVGRLSVSDSTHSDSDRVDDEKVRSIRNRRKQKRIKKEAQEPKKEKKPISRKRKIVKRSALIFSAVVAAYFGLVFLKGWTALSNIIDRAGAGSPVLGSSISISELNGEGDGRINIALLGIGGENHTGGELADTILVASIDPIADEAGILSIPRDLYVTIPGYGQNKINAAHSFGEQYGFIEPGYPDDGPGLMQKTLENTLGIPIHYYIRVDFDGFKEVVDAVDGIDITLDKRIYDPIFDREYGYHALDIGPGEVQLDGQTALLLGRARGSTGGIGLASSDFDRGDNQRLMLVALKDKALSVSTYTDPTNLLKLLDALGGHLRTNLQPGDLLRLKEIAEDIPSEGIISYGLDTAGDSYLRSSTAGGLSILVPKDGTFVAIQSFVRGIFVDGFIKSEAAVVDVLNGTTRGGLASKYADELKSFGYEIGNISNAPTQDYQSTRLIALNTQNPYTQNYLEQRYGVEAGAATTLPGGITTDADFVIILGDDAYEEETQ